MTNLAQNRYDAETNMVAEHAKSLQRTFPLMSWNRAIQVAEREIADRHVEIPTVTSPVMDSKMKTLIDGGRVIVGDIWMDEASRTDYGSEIRTCRNRHRCGIHDAYVAWIHESAKPTDLEFLPGYAIGSV